MKFYFRKSNKTLRIFISLFLGLCFVNFSNAYINQKLTFKSHSQAQNLFDSVSDNSIVTVKFEFDPYAKELIPEYMPDGYITVNNQYDMTELVAKNYYYPLLKSNNIKVLIFDMESITQKPTTKKIYEFKRLVENISSFIDRNKLKTYLVLKFDYTNSSKNAVDELYNYTTIPILINGVQIVDGYQSFLNDYSKETFLKKIKYLNLSYNQIDAQKEDFQKLLNHLKELQNLEILELQNNLISNVNHNLNMKN